MKLRRMFSVLAALLAVITFGTSTMFAQNTYKRTSVIEEFTSATCGPCVAATAPMDAVFGVNKGCLTIKYHTPIPVAGDPFYALYPDGYTRYAYYANQFSAPAAYINGLTQLNPANNQQGMQNVLDIDNAKMSPISVTVTTVGTNISIKVNSNIALTNHTLRVVVLDYHVTLTGLATEIGSNWNGESEFSNAFLKFVPNINGTAVNLGANAEQTYDMSYTAGAGRLWPAGQQYVVAFVQSNATKEVLNAGTNLKEIGAVPSFAGAKYQKIDRTMSLTREVTITNSNDSPVEIDLSVANEANLTGAGWSVTLNPSSVTVPANGSVKANMSVTAPNRSWYTDVTVTASVSGNVAFSKDNSASVGYLSSGTKIATYTGFSSGINAVADGILNSTFGVDAAFIPWNPDVMAAYPASEFDAIVVLTDYNGRGNLRFASSTISDLIAQGKKVWMGGCLDLAVGFNPQYASDPFFIAFKAIVQNTLGIKNGAAVTRSASSSQGTTLYTYPLTGIAGDPISDGMAVTLNSYGGNAWPYYTLASDLIEMISGSKSVPFIYSDNDKTKHNGVRYADANTGARVVYTTYGLELIRDNATRAAHAQKILAWLMAADVKAPVLSVSTQSLTFGTVVVNETKEMNLTITNTGNVDLNLTDYVITGADALAFSLTSGAPGNGTITVAAGKTHAVKVRFSPTMVKPNMMASLTFTSNSTTSPAVSMSGTSSAMVSVETDVVSETGAIGLRLVGENPIVSSSAVIVTGKEKVTVTLVDALGRTVNTMFDGTVNGLQNVAINAGTLTNGTYNIVATNGSEKAILTVVVTR